MVRVGFGRWWFCTSLLVVFYGGLVDSGGCGFYGMVFDFLGLTVASVWVGGLVLVVVVLDGSLVCFLLCS